MRRRLGELERMVWRIGEVCGFNCVVALSLHGRLEEHVVRRALDIVQAGHAILNAHVEDARGLAFVTEGTPRIPLCSLERKDDEHWHRTVEEELNTPFARPLGPLVRVVHLASAEQSDLVVTMHHVASDGATAVRFVAELLAAMERLHGGAEPAVEMRQLSPSLESVLPVAVRGMRGRWRTLLVTAAQLARAVVRAPMKMPVERMAGFGARRSRLVCRRLSAETTAALVATCRRAGTSVHGALAAALLQAVAAACGKPATARLCLVSPLDMRPLLRPRPADEMGLLTGAAFVVEDVRPRGELWSLARRLRNRIVAERDGGDACCGAAGRSLLSLPVRGGRLAARLLDHPVWGAAGLSNLGTLALPEAGGGLRLTRFRGVVSTGPYGSLVYLVVSTWRGELELVLAYSEPLVSATRATGIVDDTVSRLEAAVAGEKCQVNPTPIQ